ncbi:MAG: peptidoglycan DD-metalloendopeptidase family protein [Gammaproteobacteria bacterium]|nr:peptidoglycan DD-metalloendopeptidase family protein [Gammaproteobacteria bacterium]
MFRFSECDSRRNVGFLFILIFLFFLLRTAVPEAAEINTTQIEKAHKLENIRIKIKDVESSIVSAKNEVSDLYKQIQLNEIEAAKTAELIKKFDEQIKSRQDELLKLGRKKEEQLTILDKQRQQLATQVRAAYKTGRNNYLKLILNQQDAGKVGRVLAYYNYDVKARGERISSINIALEEVSSLEKKIEIEKSASLNLQKEQTSKLADFHVFRQSRKQASDKLQAFINDQGSQLEFLRANEEELKKLVSELEKQELVIQIYEERPPFNELRGKLNWPVNGKISSRFGSLSKGGKLKRQGVTIDARVGLEVKAITSGKVVFADWFRNMGLLVILDHGDGYMSLYGHNERLLKKSGDLVLAGDVIARVGDTGGQQAPGLYFEIRQAGNPVNPKLWCKY